MGGRGVGGWPRPTPPDPVALHGPPQDREQKKKQRVHEKMTYSSNVAARQASLRRELQLEDEVAEQGARAEQLRIFHEQTAWKLSMTRGVPLPPPAALTPQNPVFALAV